MKGDEIPGHVVNLQTDDAHRERPDNSRAFAPARPLWRPVLRETAQRSGPECLQGGGRGFEPLSAHNRYPIRDSADPVEPAPRATAPRALPLRSSLAELNRRAVTRPRGDSGYTMICSKRRRGRDCRGAAA